MSKSNYVSGRKMAKTGAITLDSSQKVSVADLRALGFDFSGSFTGDIKTIDSALIGPAKQAGYVNAEPLEAWISGIVRIGTAIRPIDEIAGVETSGTKFETQTVKARGMRPVGKAEAYHDLTNIPLASYENFIEERDVFRGEQGLQVGHLSQLVQGADGFDELVLKREAAQESLDILRNDIGFKGVSTMRTYGLLNDPSLPAFVSAPSGKSWIVAPTTGATFEEIITDINSRIAAMNVAAGGRVTANTRFSLVMPDDYMLAMTKVSSDTVTGQTVAERLQTMYPNLRLVYVPQMRSAGTAGADAVYLIADADDDYNAGMQTVIQVVPERGRLLGSQQNIKTFVESWINATAGVIVQKPWFVQRLNVIR